MRRYYALLLRADGSIALVKMRDRETVLATAAIGAQTGVASRLALEVAGARITAYRDGRKILEAVDAEGNLDCGAVGLVAEEDAWRR